MNKTRVLILDGSVYTDIYRPTEEWRVLLGDAPCDTVHLPSGEPVPELERYTHVIITGSEASIVEPRPWYETEASAIRRAFDLGLPMLGSCFGHQMLALALSGAQYVERTPTPEVGWIRVEIIDDDPLLEGVPRPWNVFASHFDQVVDPPPPWKVLARTDDCAVHAMRFGERPIWGLQPHPEITEVHAVTLMRGIQSAMPETAEIMQQALATPPRDDHAAARIVRNFLQS